MCVKPEINSDPAQLQDKHTLTCFVCHLTAGSLGLSAHVASTQPAGGFYLDYGFLSVHVSVCSSTWCSALLEQLLLVTTDAFCVRTQHFVKSACRKEDDDAVQGCGIDSRQMWLTWQKALFILTFDLIYWHNREAIVELGVRKKVESRDQCTWWNCARNRLNFFRENQSVIFF